MARFSSPRQFSGAGDWRNAIRSNWQYLTAWLNSIGKTTVVQLDADETIATGSTAVAFNWDSVRGDDELKAWDNVSNASRLTAIVPGRYVLLGSINWATDTAGWRVVALMKNGSGTSSFADRRAPSSQATQMQVISYPMDLVAGDYFELKVAQTSGGNLIIQTSLSTSFAMWRVG